MTIRLKVWNTEEDRRTYTFRDVLKHQSLAEVKENFFDLRNDYHYGELTQLKGTEEIIICKF